MVVLLLSCPVIGLRQRVYAAALRRAVRRRGFAEPIDVGGKAFPGDEGAPADIHPDQFAGIDQFVEGGAADAAELVLRVGHGDQQGPSTVCLCSCCHTLDRTN